jgi:GntR family transcriptional regulator
MSDRIVSVSAAYTAPNSDGTWSGWASEAARQGKQGTQQLVSVGEVIPPSDVAAALNLAAETRAVARKRIMFLDEHPIEITTSFYPVTIAAGTPLAEPARIRGGANACLAGLGHAPCRSHEVVTARMPTEQEAAELQLGEGIPVLHVVRTTKDETGIPVEVLVMVLAGDRHQLHYDL